jgi:leucyl aminopeptidase
VVLIGLGDERSASRESLRAVGGRAAKALVRAKAAKSSLAVPALRRVAGELAGQALAEGLVLGAYRFDKYKTGNDAPTALERVTLLAPDARQVPALRRGAKLGQTVAEAANFARDLSNEPGSVCTPEYLADQARKLGRSLKLKVTIYDEKELAREKMNGILAVGRGSVHPPRLIVLEYGAEPKGKGKARARKRPTLAFVGKGITFDTGGISIKPAASMDEMKHDMSGGAAVLGALRAVAELGLPFHVVGIVAAAENKPDGNAYMPGDVITSARGKTIEVLNTDAEGRIVLSDALHLATSYEPDAIVDLATLTGACVVALGEVACAVLGSDEKLADKLRAAGDATHERVWPLPLWEEHKNAIKGTFGDILNTGGRNGGVSTAAAFLSHFVGETPWAHLDIAGTAWTTKELPYYVKGATGFGVRLLIEMLRAWK